jgi:hypothetical protein
VDYLFRLKKVDIYYMTVTVNHGIESILQRLEMP